MLWNMQNVDSDFQPQAGSLSGILTVAEPVRCVRTNARLHLGGRPSYSPPRGKQRPGILESHSNNAGTRRGRTLRGWLRRRDITGLQPEPSQTTGEELPDAIWATMIVQEAIST
jgi:hypothetical protein